MAKLSTSPQHALPTQDQCASASAAAAWVIWHATASLALRKRFLSRKPPSSANAVASAGKGATQVFTDAVIDGVHIVDALVDSGSALSMLSTAMYGRLPSTPAIQHFTRSAPDVIGVGRASAEIREYVDVPVLLDGIAVRHPLLVVEGLAFSLLIGTDIIKPHDVMLLPNKPIPLRLRTPVCDVCQEQRTNVSGESSSVPLIACAVFKLVIEPYTAALVQVRMPRELRDFPNITTEPLASQLEDHGCAALLAVCAPADSVCYVAVANPSERRVDIAANAPISAVAPVDLTANSVSSAAVAPQLSINTKLRKVMHKLRIDSLPDSTAHKRR